MVRGGHRSQCWLITNGNKNHRVEIAGNQCHQPLPSTCAPILITFSCLEHKHSAWHGAKMTGSSRREPRSLATCSGTGSGSRLPHSDPGGKHPSFSELKKPGCSLRVPTSWVGPFPPHAGFEKHMSSNSASLATGRELRKRKRKTKRDAIKHY